MRLREPNTHGSDPDADSMRLADDDGHAGERGRPRRPRYLIAASLMLVVLAVVLWGKWSESQTEAQQLRAELKQVYFEAETLRTQANQAQQQVALLEQQVRSLTTERTEILKRLEAAGGEKRPLKTKPATKPTRKRPAPTRG